MDKEQFEQWQGTMQAQEGARVTLDTTCRHADMANKIVDCFTSQTTPTDGTSPQAVRDWMSDIILTQAQTRGDHHLIEIASRTARCPLRRELELYIAERAADYVNPTPRHEVTWDALRIHLSREF